jgi:hypothetical protein
VIVAEGVRRLRAAVPLLVLSGCAPGATSPQPMAASGSRGWMYEVRVLPNAAELRVEGTFPAGTDPELGIDDDAEPFVRDVAVARGPDWQEVAGKGGTWTVPVCQSLGCRIQYRFLLADAAAALGDADLAMVHRGAVVAPPSTWLLRPMSGPLSDPFLFHVSTAPGMAFATGVFPWQGRSDTFGAAIAFLSAAPYSAFGEWRLSRVETSSGSLEIGVAPGTFAAGEHAITDWIAAAADVVSRYYRGFPVTRALLLVVPTEGAGFGYGKALGNGGASIVVPVGERTTRAALADDWVLVHEMIHLALPDLPREQIWLAEGVATYVEPIARARVGRLSPEGVWRGLLRGLPNGLPAEGDQGLDRTHTWGRTYWGGALFCFLADIEIRKRTDNHRSLDEALRAILAEGGNATVRWPLARLLERGDAATGVLVLSELHEKMGTHAYPVDLAQLFRDLGVKLTGNAVTFDDSAPLARLRRSMTGPT